MGRKVTHMQNMLTEIYKVHLKNDVHNVCFLFLNTRSRSVHKLSEASHWLRAADISY